MKSFIKKASIFALAFGIVSNCIAQKQLEILQGSRFVSRSQFGGVQEVGSPTSNFLMCKGVRFEITSPPSGGNAQILIKHIPKKCSTTNSVQRGIEYSIPVSRIASMRRPFVGLAVGPLVVPAKIEPASGKIYAGGQLGLFVGPRLNFGNNGFIAFVGSAGFGNISVSNTTPSSPPQNTNSVLGYYTAFGPIINVYHGFSLGLIFGNDTFNINDERKSRSWISLGITTPLDL